MKLSIIICVYNVSPELLQECLDSLMREELYDCEIILVDDGSHIDYNELVAPYPARLYKSEKNRGLLSARLTGIEISTGEYIAFVDGDDTVSLCYHLPMLYAAEKHSADIVINGWAFHSGKSRRCCIGDASMSGKIDTRSEASLQLYTSAAGRDHSLYVQWNKLYSRSLLEKTAEELRRRGIHEMKLTYGEDALMNFFNFKNAARVVGINSGFYLYRCHDGQCTAASEKHRLAAQIESIAFVLGLMRDELNEGSQAWRGVLAWQELTARAQYARARAGGHTELYGLIRERLGVSELRMPLPSDEEIYLGCELLGDNFDRIDFAMRELLCRRGDLSVCYELSCRYVQRIIDSYDGLWDRRSTYSQASGLVIPRRKIPTIHKIIHHPRVARLAARVIKKGSPLRAYLKRKL